MLEDYFAQSPDALKEDERPELSYQVSSTLFRRWNLTRTLMKVGVTLENTEKPKCAVDEPCLDVIARLDPAERPLDISAHNPDPKCRFFWRMGETPPYETQYPGLNAANVIPKAPHLRDRWPAVMEKWGSSMKNAYASQSIG